MAKIRKPLFLVPLVALTMSSAWASEPLGVTELSVPANPVMPGADPHAVLIDGTFWMYPTHFRDEKRFYAWSSTNLQTWQQHGPVLDFRDVRWIKDDGAPRHFAWAPCISTRNGKFFFYYSVGPQNPTAARLGVAVGDSPQGPFIDSGKPLLTGGNGFEAIDPMVFADPSSGKYYLYAGGSAGATLRAFELAEDMVQFAREVPVKTPPQFTEGVFMHLHEGVYYLTYSHGSYRHSSYSLHYATATSPVGPWDYRGSFLTSDNHRKGPGHHSLIRLPNSSKTLLFYHRWDNVQGDGPYKGSRQIAIEWLNYDAEGLIIPIRMTGLKDKVPAS